MPFQYRVVRQGTRDELQTDVEAMLNERPPNDRSSPWDLVGGVSITSVFVRSMDEKIGHIEREWAQALRRFLDR